MEEWKKEINKSIKERKKDRTKKKEKRNEELERRSTANQKAIKGRVDAMEAIAKKSGKKWGKGQKITFSE